MVKAALPHRMPSSSIVYVGSIAGMCGRGRLMDETAMKGAIHAFTRSLGQDFVERGIRGHRTIIRPGERVRYADRSARRGR